jgi:ornithine cyclodeaminase/alanine dehydrogenase-like protein (mu-crystallin family)
LFPRSLIDEILARPEAATIPPSMLVLFKTVGMTIEDLTAARFVWESSNQGRLA